jgi:hypothetical protein
MKRAFLSIAAVGALVMFAVAAQASGDEYYEHGGYGRPYYGGGGYYGGGYYGTVEFYGPVEAMPPTGFAGMWRIGGRDVVVNPSTFIKEEYGRIGIGAQVEVKGRGNPLVAYEIEVKRGRMRGTPMPPPAMGGMMPINPNPVNPMPPAMAGESFSGAVDSLPPSGFLGTWRIAGRDVIVNNGTRLKQENGPIGAGVKVAVKGGGNPFVAYEIEVQKN